MAILLFGFFGSLPLQDGSRFCFLQVCRMCSFCIRQLLNSGYFYKQPFFRCFVLTNRLYGLILNFRPLSGEFTRNSLSYIRPFRTVPGSGNSSQPASVRMETEASFHSFALPLRAGCFSTVNHYPAWSLQTFARYVFCRDYLCNLGRQKSEIRNSRNFAILVLCIPAHQTSFRRKLFLSSSHPVNRS